jgi:hypothetical protein
MSARNSVRSSVPASKKDRSALCTFTFADGRCCRTPRHAVHSPYCFFHARKLAQARAAEELGRDIAAQFSSAYLSANDLSFVLGRLFAAAAQGHIKPKTAATLAYLGQVLLQTIRLSQDEFISAFGSEFWRTQIRASFAQASIVPVNPPIRPSTPPPTPPPPPTQSQPESQSPSSVAQAHQPAAAQPAPSSPSSPPTLQPKEPPSATRELQPTTNEPPSCPTASPCNPASSTKNEQEPPPVKTEPPSDSRPPVHSFQ